jgi:hypothetical protein
LTLKTTVPVALRERLGDDATFAFYDYIESSGENWRRDVTTVCTERMDLRMEHLASRQDLVEGFARVREEMGNLRVELLRWSFAFWIGQVAAPAGLMALLIRLLQP